MGVRFRVQAENVEELFGDVLSQSPSACSDSFAEQIMSVFIKRNCAYRASRTRELQGIDPFLRCILDFFVTKQVLRYKIVFYLSQIKHL
jgi:hypothetical protein